MSEARTPFAAHCHPCGHVWVVIWLPASANIIPKKYRCPACHGTNRIMLAGRDAVAKLPTSPLICEVPDVG